MLSLHPVSASSEHYFLREASESYYLDDAEEVGTWGGEAAKALGLLGAVEKKQFANVLNGFTPDGRRALVQLQQYTRGRSRQRGWDLTFSAPKDVSILWAVADAALRRAIVEVHVAAVLAAQAFIQSRAALSRRARGRVERAALLWAQFQHATSRANDPQLHTHVVIANTCLREDGTWGTLRSKDLYQHKLAAGAVYRAELARLLRLKLGVVLSAARFGFAIDGIPRSLVAAFSKRRAAVVAELASNGLAGAKEAAKATLRTRPRKSVQPIAALREHWKAVAAEHGFGPEQAQALLGRATLAPEREERLATRVAERVTRRAAAQGPVVARDVVARVANTLAARGVATSTILAAAQRATRAHARAAKHGIADLSPPVPGRIAPGTAEVLSVAERLANRRARTPRRLLVIPNLGAADELSPEQRTALSYITSPEQSLACLCGVSGTGKTHLLTAARKHWERRGYRVLGAAASPVGASTLLRETGIQSYTCAALLRRFPGPKERVRHHASQLVRAARGRRTYAQYRERFDSRTVLVVDHTEFAGAPSLLALLRRCERAHTKVVLVGDDSAANTWGKVGLFATLVERLGTARLVEQRRSQEAPTEHTLPLLARGEQHAAFFSLARAGQLVVRPNQAQALERVLTDWERYRTRDLARVLVITGDEGEQQDINTRVQRMRRRSLEVGLLHVRHQGTRFHARDRIFIESARTEAGLIKGEFGTITHLDGLLGRKCLHVRLDREVKRWLGSSHVRIKIPLTKHAKLRLGYAQLASDCHGLTLDRVLVLGGEWLRNSRQAYAALSRARERTQVYLSASDAGPELRAAARTVRAGNDEREQAAMKRQATQSYGG